MVSSLLGNLDKSLTIVPAGQCASYFLYADGSVTSHPDSWTSYFSQKFQGFYDPTAANLIEVFMGCVDHWIALKNDQKFNRRVVAIDEFTQQIKRICLVGQFILAYLNKIETHSSAKEKICALLSQLLPGRTIILSRSLQEVVPETFLGQLDFATIWKMEETVPLVLTEAILKCPAPQIEVLDPSQSSPNIAELPAFYKTFIQRMENPTGGWLLWLKDWWSGVHQKDQQSLENMCTQILEDKTPAQQLIYSSGKLYLGRLLALFKKGEFPEAPIRMCLDELVYASSQCPGDWATVAERQHLLLTGKETTAQDKALQWKSAFIDDHLSMFFSTVYTESEVAHDVHLMNTLLFHYGKRLGKQDLEVPTIDIHVVKKSTSLPYQWPDVFRYLTKAWEEHSIESFKTYSQMNGWQLEIGKFLIAKVKEKTSSIQDPEEFVRAEYFNQQGLNSRGAIRFLREALPSNSQTRLRTE